MAAPDRACPDYPNECVHPWAHARTYAEVKATQEPVTAADHPHADPGDGRQECDRCGKWVWPAIHSCKGVPVTAAARARWDAARAAESVTVPNPADDLAKLSEASGDPEAFRLVYSALMQRYADSCRLGHMTQFADEVAAHAVQTLRDAGRLCPADARAEWSVACQSCSQDGWTPGPGCSACRPVPSTPEETPHA